MEIGPPNYEIWRRRDKLRGFTWGLMGLSVHLLNDFMISTKVSFWEAGLESHHSVVYWLIYKHVKIVKEDAMPLQQPTLRTRRATKSHWTPRSFNILKSRLSLDRQGQELSSVVSDLLNDISKSASAHCNDANPHLDVHISTHVTQKCKNLSTYIYRYLLECHRTEENPASPLTGLLNPTHFGRPDLAKIMDEHYESMLKLFEGASEKGDRKKRKVGVFFCGEPPIGYELADRCQLLTLRGRENKSFIEYHFMMEVFG